MIYSTQGIVLHHTKYAESSIIAHIYTEEFGRQSYIINQVRSKKNRGKTVFLQPLALLNLQVYHSPKATIQRIKEFKIATPLYSIPFHQHKRAIAFFIAEILYKVLREEEKNNSLFQYIFNSIELLDKQENNYDNYHVYFILYLTKHLGFFPLKPTSENDQFFDLQKGYFLTAEPNHPYFLNSEESKVLKQILTTTFTDLNSLKINRLIKSNLIQHLIDYYAFHIENFGQVKSLQILKDLFN